VKLDLRWPDDVAVAGVTPEKTAVKKDDTCNISVTVENLGGYSETFNVTLYANTTTIGSMIGVTLPNGTSQILSFQFCSGSSKHNGTTLKGSQRL
jgi:hypothetical protein